MASTKDEDAARAVVRVRVVTRVEKSRKGQRRLLSLRREGEGWVVWHAMVRNGRGVARARGVAAEGAQPPTPAQVWRRRVACGRRCRGVKERERKREETDRWADPRGGKEALACGAQLEETWGSDEWAQPE
jgi:hypothetical protein